MGLTLEELKVVYDRSAAWTGPNCWGWRDRCRLDLHQTLACPEYG
jgi:hypothetical protein